METYEMETGSKEERGVRSPGFSLPEALELLRQVRTGVGYGRASRDTVAKAMGFTSLNGRSNRAIGALTHFGLMERSGAAALQISDLGRRLLMPRDDVESRDGLAQAAMEPTLYQRLFGRFGGHGLPSLLPNILVREFGVHANTSEDVARIFRESVEFAGLLRHGILHTEPEPAESTALVAVSASSTASQAPLANAPVAVAPSTVDGPPPVSPVGAGTQRYTIPLDSQGRLATIDIPLPVAPGDLRRVAKWAQFMLSLEDE
ncbi:hypothetical protein [Roseisolibacter sp. H3M3-2]|uniref:hypothetical protein n=1 Tax=Roseisolibacter sp. H3M3-2 TaxID=3031323 RepID=UPI0023D995BB|nr:hypothetical protein [Roseisolibacter sp. H3M3-2]MDF1504392.1 hypothetical protein [Roseisolibacter sp. H3M3-2]